MFKSEGHCVIFALTELEGRQRNKVLGITVQMYKSKLLADQWCSQITEQVNKTWCELELKVKALDNLSKLHGMVTDH